MKLEVNCTFKAHIPQMVNVPGKLVLNDNILLFKAYGKEYTPVSYTHLTLPTNREV